jgi:Tfp pilus assembly protein PilP
MKIRNYLLLIIVAAMMLLLSCGRRDSFQDLRNYIHKEISRTPFEDVTIAQGSAISGRNPVIMYALNLLRFLGTVSQDNQIWAYIMTPDNKIYQVTIGNAIGDHNGKIAKISQNELQVIEQTSEEGKQTGQRIVTLQVKEAGSQ